jgi:alpha-mannosidase
MPHTLHVISHTHWDREWYLTFQQFRMRLVDLIDNLLSLLDRDPNFRTFHLDAQTIVLEDYLAIRPQNRARLEASIRAGRITIGPWYQLNDEFLTSGEATVRSLLVGTRIARSFGACLSLGYLPDQFGNLSQMPQIFRGFGIDNAIFGRGYQLTGDRKMEFLWESPDGSQVTASLMAYWYNNAQHFPAEPQAALDYTLELKDRMTPVSVVSHLLLMNGVDHLEAQQDLSPILAALQPLLPEGDQILHSNIQTYIDAVKAEVVAKKISLARRSGELREDRGGSCLAGTLSTRMYLKQANHHAQVLLEKYAEPFAVFAARAGADYPYDFLHYTWKLLMQNHPHDSICGCSLDAVHRDMMTRFAQVEQIGEELVARSLQTVADQAALPGAPGAETGLVVFNSLNWLRSDPMHATLVFPLGIPTRGNPPRDDNQRVQGFKLLDEQGKEVPFALINETVEMRQVLSPVELPLDQWVQQFAIEFVAQDVPACGYRAYRVERTAAMPVYPPAGAGRAPDWQPFYEDCGDVGDEYLHRKPAQDRRILQPVLSGQPLEERTAARTTRVYSTLLNLPATAIGLEARSEELVACRAVTRVTRWDGSPRVEYETSFDNRAQDHRLRVCFQSQPGFAPQPFSIAEGQFDVVRRPLVHPLEAEGASLFHPQQNWVALAARDGQMTVAVLNQGLPEYEIYPDGISPNEENPYGEGAQIAVTLVRGVTYISRRGDGPQLVTPEAQCLGENTYRYALLECDGDWQTAAVWKQSWQFSAPLRAIQTEKHAQDRPLPAQHSFLTLGPDCLVVTAFKRAEDDPRKGVVRFFNISDETVENGTLRMQGAQSAAYTNLNEEDPSPLSLDLDGTANLKPIRPKEIVTLIFGF